jgi:hypothetical protein
MVRVLPERDERPSDALIDTLHRAKVAHLARLPLPGTAAP